MSFTDRFYDFLDRIGYLHPIHPAMTHMPIGLVVGALLFGWIALGSRQRQLALSAWHALVVALAFVFPTMLFGFMDWQRYYAGAWLFPIRMKLILASILLILLVLGVWIGRPAKARFGLMLTVISLAFLTVTALGYYGGQLVYAGAAPAGPARYRAGQKVFDNNCTGCHAHGGNVIRPNLPLRSAPQLVSFSEFDAFLRNPRLPNGAVGPMPPFPPSSISGEKSKELYEYILNVIARPKRQ